MNPDYGILISTPGVSVNGISTDQTLLNSNNSFFKLDTQNPASLQTTLLLITTDPPEPTVGNENWTVIGQYKHGYTYAPMIESLYYVINPPTTNFYQTYALSTTSPQGIILSAMDPGDFVYLYVVADKTYVYFIVHRQLFIGSTTLLTGTTLQITTHVFVENVS